MLARLDLAALAWAAGFFDGEAQVRLKGNATHCVRGHAYTHTAKRGGRLRRVCNACSRLLERQKRAAQGIKPRQFKNAARRYEF